MVKACEFAFTVDSLDPLGHHRACFDSRRGRDAADFARFPAGAARSAMRDIGQARRQTGRAKSMRPGGFRRKSASGSSKRSTVLPDTLFALLLP